MSTPRLPHSTSAQRGRSGPPAGRKLGGEPDPAGVPGEAAAALAAHQACSRPARSISYDGIVEQGLDRTAVTGLGGASLLGIQPFNGTRRCGG